MANGALKIPDFVPCHEVRMTFNRMANTHTLFAQDYAKCVNQAIKRLQSEGK